ncbi:hypothetical protein QAD02_023969 [Eretmocerus hayati]|uniref:Uncharacterized protein n=1 Tax=Eretmocerus hayati TaxID=131215 RepID=A0ACC2PZX0_9HYME|nr:hypothetical protein QAD02_023969 [Eretmocerus hayati]
MAPKRRLELGPGSFGEAACKKVKLSAKFRLNVNKTTPVRTIEVPIPMATKSSPKSVELSTSKRLDGKVVDSSSSGIVQPALNSVSQAKLNKELFSAIRSTYSSKENSFELVKKLIKKGANVNAKDDKGSPLLFKALNYSSFDIVELLLKSGADPNCTNSEGAGSLNQAIGCDVRGEVGMGGDATYSTLKLLLDSGANINQKNKRNQTVLWDAVETAEKDMVDLLLKRGADASILDSEGYSILHCLANMDWSDVLRKEFHFRDYFIKCSRLLQANGAKLSLADLNDKHGTTLEKFIQYGNKKEAKIFLKHWKKGVRGVENPLHTAAGNPLMRGLELLLESGLFDVNQRDSSGETPVHVAARCDHEHNLRLLLEYGADPNAETNWHAETPYLIARKEQLWPHIRLLESYGAKKPSDSELEDCCGDEENGCPIS